MKNEKEIWTRDSYGLSHWQAAQLFAETFWPELRKVVAWETNHDGLTFRVENGTHTYKIVLVKEPDTGQGKYVVFRKVP